MGLFSMKPRKATWDHHCKTNDDSEESPNGTIGSRLSFLGIPHLSPSQTHCHLSPLAMLNHFVGQNWNTKPPVGEGLLVRWPWNSPSNKSKSWHHDLCWDTDFTDLNGSLGYPAPYYIDLLKKNDKKRQFGASLGWGLFLACPGIRKNPSIPSPQFPSIPN